MGVKYCKKLHPTIMWNSGASRVWRKMVVVGKKWNIRLDGMLEQLTLVSDLIIGLN